MLKGPVRHTGRISRTSCLSSWGDGVSFIGTIQFTPHCADISHAEHCVTRELALSGQIEVHGVRCAQVGAVGVDAHRFKEAEVEGCISWVWRGEGELIGNGG